MRRYKNTSGKIGIQRSQTYIVTVLFTSLFLFADYCFNIKGFCLEYATVVAKFVRCATVHSIFVYGLSGAQTSLSNMWMSRGWKFNRGDMLPLPYRKTGVICRLYHFRLQIMRHCQLFVYKFNYSLNKKKHKQWLLTNSASSFLHSTIVWRVF